MRILIILWCLSLLLGCGSQQEVMDQLETVEETDVESAPFDRANNALHPVVEAKWWTPPKDVDGNVPANIIIHFLNLIHEGRYEDAKTLWILNQSQRTPPIDFVEYCHGIEHLQITDIEYMARGKSGWWHVYFEDKRYYSLVQMDGRWMISRAYRW
jgi:hypothetical protein